MYCQSRKLAFHKKCLSTDSTKKQVISSHLKEKDDNHNDILGTFRHVKNRSALAVYEYEKPNEDNNSVIHLKNLEIDEQNETTLHQLDNDKNVIIEDLEDVEYQEDREHFQADQQDLQEMSAKL